jgi:hypothetical protein
VAVSQVTLNRVEPDLDAASAHRVEHLRAAGIAQVVEAVPRLQFAQVTLALVTGPTPFIVP